MPKGEREAFEYLLEEVEAFLTGLNKNFDPVPYYAATESDVEDLRFALRTAQDELDAVKLKENTND